MIKIKDRMVDECIPLSPLLAAMLACQDFYSHREDDDPIAAAKSKAVCGEFDAGLASNKLVLRGGIDASAIVRRLFLLEDLGDEGTVENLYRDARHVGAQQTATPWLALDEGARKHLFNECSQLASRIRALKRATQPFVDIEFDGNHQHVGRLVVTSASIEDRGYDKVTLDCWVVSPQPPLASEEHADD